MVDVDKAPIEGAKVLYSLAGGWSPEAEPLVTDKLGVATIEAPAAGLLVGVEKAGYALVEPKVWRPASVDQLWSDLRSIAPAGSRPKAHYSSAYGHWNAALPRARGYQLVDSGTSDVELAVQPLGAILFEVSDAKGDFPLPNTRVTSRYGGLDAGHQIASTALDGTVQVSLVDREWQPLLVSFSAPGYATRTIAIPPGPAEGFPVPYKIKLRESEDDSSSPGDVVPNGLLLGTRGLVSGEVIMYEGGPYAKSAVQLYRGSADTSGGFVYGLRDAPLPKGLYAYAVHRSERTGLPTLGMSSGLIEPKTHDPSDPLRLQLEPGIPLAVTLDGLEMGRPYRLDWSLKPFQKARTLLSGSIAVPDTHNGRFDIDIPVPRGWRLSATVFGASVGQGPELEFTRDSSGLPFPSTRPTWETWEPVSSPVELDVLFHGRRLYQRVARRVDLSGTVTDLPFYPTPDRVQVAAMGSAGTWFSPITSNGWFDLPALPPGTYRLVVYERPSSLEGPVDPYTQGQVRAQLVVEMEFSRHDVQLPWDKTD